MKTTGLSQDWRKLASLALIPFSLILIVIFTFLDIRTATEPPFLLTILNTVFIGIIPLVIAAIAFRSYRSRGSKGLFMLGSGMMIFGLGSIAAGWLIGLPGGANISVAIYNVCIFVSGVFYLSGALLTFTRNKPSLSSGPSWKIVAMAAGIVIFVAVFIILAIAGSIPPFFIVGTGPTVLRQVILSHAIALLTIASLLLFHLYRLKQEDFFFWYSVSLAVIAIGLIAALFIPAIGSPVNWVSRVLQYIGAFFALVAIIVAGRLARFRGNSLEDTLSRFFSEAEAGYKSLIETANDAIVVFDSANRVIVWNRAAEMMLGYSESEAVGASFFSLAIPDSFVDIIKNKFRIPSAADKDQVDHTPVEIVARRKDRSTFPAELTLSRHMISGTEVSTCIIRDLTERKKREEALRESEERYRTRFNALIEGFCVIEMVFDSAGKPVDYRFVEINPAFEAQTGLHNATGKLMRDMAPSHEQHWFDIYGKVALTGEPVHFENEAAALGRWYEVRAFRVGGEESRKVAVCFNDISERKNAEAEKSNLAAIVEYSDDAIVGKTLDGIITTWNAGAEKIYGYSAAEVIGRSVSILIPPEKTDDFEYILSKIKRGESFVHYETERMKKDGTLIQVSLTMSPIRNSTGKLTGASTITRDITNRKRAEKALKDSEEKFRVLFTRMVEGSALHELVYSVSGDPVDYRILDINPSFEHILGLKRGDVIGKTSKEAYGVDAPPYFELYRRVAETGQPEEFEVFFAPMKKHFTISAYSPEPGKFATIFTDITGRKTAEEKVRNLLSEVQCEKDRLSSLIHSISDEVWFADTEKNFTLANPTALREFALGADTIDIEKFAASLEVYRPDGTPRPVEEAPPLRALKGEEVRNFEEMVRTPATGEVRYRQVNSNPVRDTSGNIIGAVSVVRDITELIKAEEELRESEERFRLALRNAPVSVALQDTDLIYRWAYNQTTRRTDEIIGMTDTDLFAKEDVEWLTPLKQRILRTGEDAHTENWLTSNGRRVYLDLYFEPLRNKGGEITGIGIATVNLTDLKLAKEELQKKNDNLNALNEELTATEEELNQNIEELSLREEDLSKALAEKEVLLSEIHHRVKNNLTAFISLLSLEGATEETPAGRSLKQDLQNRARSMALIHETLYRTHMYNNVDMEMYLATLVDQVTHLLQTSRQVKVNVDAHGVLLDIPRATPSGLIINELITNAFKYAFPDSFDSQKVRNAPPTINVTFAQIGGEYVMSVRDNGIGLPPGLDISTTKTLGLKLVNFLARHQLSATIEVNTVKGTEFIFRFKV